MEPEWKKGHIVLEDAQAIDAIGGRFQDRKFLDNSSMLRVK
jgi:hypothetical protein